MGGETPDNFTDEFFESNEEIAVIVCGDHRIMALVSPDAAQAAITPAAASCRNGHLVTAFADVDASIQLSAVGFLVLEFGWI